jgi:hypothetical protein
MIEVCQIMIEVCQIMIDWYAGSHFVPRSLLVIFIGSAAHIQNNFFVIISKYYFPGFFSCVFSDMIFL